MATCGDIEVKELLLRAEGRKVNLFFRPANAERTHANTDTVIITYILAHSE